MNITVYDFIHNDLNITISFWLVSIYGLEYIADLKLKTVGRLLDGWVNVIKINYQCCW